jgi:hypothetical protein
VKRATAALIALALTASLAACAEQADESPLGDDTSGEAGRGNSNGDGETGDGTGSIEWSDCGPGECADVEVPVDYDEPDGDTNTLSVARSPATGERIGALFMNPGGPGT